MNRFVAAIVVSSVVANAVPASALSLTGSGTSGTLGGTLGTVDVVANVDSPILDGALTNGGLVASGLNIPALRIQYDLLNRDGNFSIFDFRVDFPAGTTVIAAANPGTFRRADGTLETYWAGSNFSTLLDSGYGLYTADRDNHGSEWIVDYQTDHVTWHHIGNGFFPNTATGRTDVGVALPTFSLDFKPGTPLVLQPALASGRSVTGAPTSAAGRVLSAGVPEPATLGLALGAVALSIAGRRRR